MSISGFLLSFSGPLKEIGIPEFTSGQCDIELIRAVLVPKPIRQQE